MQSDGESDSSMKKTIHLGVEIEGKFHGKDGT